MLSFNKNSTGVACKHQPGIQGQSSDQVVEKSSPSYYIFTELWKVYQNVFKMSNMLDDKDVSFACFRIEFAVNDIQRNNHLT